MRAKVKTYNHGPIGDILGDMAEGSGHYDYSVVPIETLQHWREHESFIGETDTSSKMRKSAIISFKENGHRWDVKYFKCLDEHSLSEEQDMCFISFIKCDGRRKGGSKIQIAKYEKAIEYKRVMQSMDTMVALAFLVMGL